MQMISCKLCGGLGNQLFQIFTAIAYAIKYSKPFFFLLCGGKNFSVSGLICLHFVQVHCIDTPVK